MCIFIFSLVGHGLRVGVGMAHSQLSSLDDDMISLICSLDDVFYLFHSERSSVE